MLVVEGLLLGTARTRNESKSWLRSNSATASWVLILPAAALICAFYLVPIVKVLWISVTEPEPGLGNYLLLITNEGVRRALLTTLRISLVTTIISIVMAYIVAYALLNASSTGRKVMMIFVILPFWISVLVRAFSWMVLLGRTGVINKVLLSTGLISAPLEMMYDEFGVDVGMVHYMVPVATLTLYANMLGINQQVLAAARSLGATRFQTFLRVFLPLSLPGVIAASVLVFVFSTGFFVTPALLGGGKTLMAAEYITVMVNETLRWGIATMLASSLLIVILLAMAALSRIFNLQKLFGAA
jgi:putative spermidine/putrescine transport system permease protein